MHYDSTILAEHCDNDPVLMRRVIGLFLADHAAQLECLRRALDEQDLDRLYSVAHSIKGAAANFGAHEALVAARTVETCCRERRMAGAAGSVTELDSAIRALAQELKAALI